MHGVVQTLKTMEEEALESGDEDTDGDGIPDSNDNCPNEYADSSNDADNDGCVDGGGDGNGDDSNGGGTSDADNDGVVDDDDMCPTHQTVNPLI